MKNKVVFFIALIFLLSFLVSCTTSTLYESNQIVGIFMPGLMNGHWETDGIEMRQILENKNYEVRLFFASQDSSVQKEQINNMIEYGVDALIINAVDADDLAKTLDKAGEQGIKVIAYRKLLTNTDAVNYFVSFDNNLIGIQQGVSLIEGMYSQGKGPYNIEIFPESYMDDNARSYYAGAMSVIKPLIESGEIKVISNEISFDDIVSSDYNLEAIADRINHLLYKYYSNGKKLNGILSFSDAISTELINVIDESNMFASSKYPIITGQNAEIDNINAIINSKQYSTVFKNHKLLAQIACNMTIAALNNEFPEINDTTSFYNGVKTVPTFLCESILVTKENYKSVLIDSGYLAHEDIFPEIE